MHRRGSWSVAGPCARSQGQDAERSAREVADLVFLIDVSGSMAPIIDALKRIIEMFIDSLSAGEGNNVSPVRDWRAKAVGHRDLRAFSSPEVVVCRCGIQPPTAE